MFQPLLLLIQPPLLLELKPLLQPPLRPQQLGLGLELKPRLAVRLCQPQVLNYQIQVFLAYKSL